MGAAQRRGKGVLGVLAGVAMLALLGVPVVHAALAASGRAGQPAMASAGVKPAGDSSPGGPVGVQPPGSPSPTVPPTTITQTTVCAPDGGPCGGIYTLPTSHAGCPDPRTCAAYQLNGVRYPTDARGRVYIHYMVNPTQPWYTDSEAVQMWAVAASIWEAADPAVHFVYDGTTDQVPVLNAQSQWLLGRADQAAGTQLAGGVSVFGFAPIAATSQLAEAWFPPDGPGAPVAGSSPSHARPVDIVIDDTTPMTYDPCPQTNGGCTPVPETDAQAMPACQYNQGSSICSPTDIVALIVHELGQLLGLGTLSLPYEDQLSMYMVEPGPGLVDRSGETLGLGDILGVRAVYPCAQLGCPPPTVYTP